MKKCRRKCCVADRKYIAELQQSLSRTASTLRMTEQRLSNAKGEAFTEFSQHSGLLAQATYDITKRLSEMLGNELMKVAKKVIASSNYENRIPLSLTSSESYSEKRITVIRGEIDRINYNVTLGF